MRQTVTATQSKSNKFRTYCPQCRQNVRFDIGAQSESNYHGDDVSPVRCSDCGTVLGYLHWYPTEE